MVPIISLKLISCVENGLKISSILDNFFLIYICFILLLLGFYSLWLFFTDDDNNMTWPEVLKFLFDCANSPDAGLRESALNILA